MKADAEASAVAHNAPGPSARQVGQQQGARRHRSRVPESDNTLRADHQRHEPIRSTIRLYQRTVRSDAVECGNLSSSVWFEYKITIDDYPNWKSRPYR